MRPTGFEVALHHTTNCTNFTPASLDQSYDDQLADFATQYPSVPAPTTNRTHCIAWSDWASQPKVELDHGIRFDTNYYYWPPELGRRHARVCSRARRCRCASPISMAR